MATWCWWDEIKVIFQLSHCCILKVFVGIRPRPVLVHLTMQDSFRSPLFRSHKSSAFLEWFAFNFFDFGGLPPCLQTSDWSERANTYSSTSNNQIQPIAAMKARSLLGFVLLIAVIGATGALSQAISSTSIANDRGFFFFLFFFFFFSCCRLVLLG